MPSILVEDGEVDAAHLLLVQTEKLALEGGSLPSQVDIVKQASKHLKRGLDVGEKAKLPSWATTRRLNRSKRKVFFTVAGPAIALGATALAGGPIGWAVVGTTIGVAFLVKGSTKAWRSKRASYYDKKYLRSVRTEKGWDFEDSKSALNGVRYVLGKRSLSRISDDVKELCLALHEYGKRRNRKPTSCREAAELAYWYYRVCGLNARLGEHYKCFDQFYHFVVDSLSDALIKADDAMTDQNMERALGLAHAWVNRDFHDHVSACNTKGGEHESPYGFSCCYGKHGSKPHDPRVSTIKRLSSEQRRPFVRLCNDAQHINVHGEHGHGSYKDRRDELKTMFEGTAIALLFGHTSARKLVMPKEQTSSVLLGKLALITPARLDPQSSTLEGGFVTAKQEDPFEGIGTEVKEKRTLRRSKSPPPLLRTKGQRDLLASLGPMLGEERPESETSTDESSEKTSQSKRSGQSLFGPKRQELKRSKRMGNLLLGSLKERVKVEGDTGSRLGASGGTALAGSGAGLAGKGAMRMMGMTTAKEFSKGVTVSLSTGGFGLALALIEASTEVLNLKNETKALKRELSKRRLEDVDVNRFMTALRTIMKDGGVFEKCIDEMGKVLEYHKEFGAALALATSEGGKDMDCCVAFELVYRLVKTFKHIDTLNQYLPIVSLYASFTEAMLRQAEALEGNEALKVANAVKEWVDDGDHSRCKDAKGSPDLCYSGLDQ